MSRGMDVAKSGRQKGKWAEMLVGIYGVFLGSCGMVRMVWLQYVIWGGIVVMWYRRRRREEFI
jgi:hypothetical protein